MPNFNDVYLHNYKVLDYGLICKNNPKLGLLVTLRTYMPIGFCPRIPTKKTGMLKNAYIYRPNVENCGN
jgi:hypothetical protein